MFYLLGVVVYLFGVFWCMLLKGVPISFLLVPAAIFLILFTIVAVLTATQGFKAFGAGLQAAVFPQKPLSEELRGRAATLFRLLSKSVALAALLMVLCSIISALGNAEDTAMLGYAVTSALVAPVWAILLITAVFEPVVFLLKRRQGER